MLKSGMTLLTLLLTLHARGATPSPDCWARAIGTGPHSIHRQAAFVTGGLEGTFRVWSRADDAYRLETIIPSIGIRNVQAYDGLRAWKADGATRAHELTELELAAIITDAFFENGRAPRAAAASETPNAFVVSPPGGSAVTVMLDPATCLPRSYTRKLPNATSTTTIEEWTRVGGMALPAVARQSTGDPKFDVTVRYTSTKLDEPMPDALFARPPAAKAVSIPSGAPYVELPFELTQHHIYLPVQLADRKSWFVLDTGAEATVVDAEVAKAFGLVGSGSIAAVGNGESTVTAQAIAKPSLTVAGMKMPLDTMYAIPLRALWPREGRALQGILGYDVLSHFVVEIDYAASRIRLHDPERFTPPAGAASLPMTYEGNIPAVRTAFALPGGRRVEGRMIVDTGNSGGLDLYGPFVDAQNIRTAVTGAVQSAGGMGVGGISKQDMARIDAFLLGPFILPKPIVTLSRDAKGAAAHPELAGNIGGRVLRRFTVFLDYPHDRMLLRPNDSFSMPFEHDMSGLALVAEGAEFDRVVVRRVLPETAAAAAGFAEGDEITTVDGEAAGLHHLRELFQQPDRTYDVGIRRGSEALTLQLTTRRRI